MHRFGAALPLALGCPWQLPFGSRPPQEYPCTLKKPEGIRFLFFPLPGKLPPLEQRRSSLQKVPSLGQGLLPRQPPQIQNKNALVKILENLPQLALGNFAEVKEAELPGQPTQNGQSLILRTQIKNHHFAGCRTQVSEMAVQGQLPEQTFHCILVVFDQKQ